MTPQKLFDDIVTFQRKQGEKCSGANDGCFYRGPGGLRCAVGCVIPDKLYHTDMEGRDVRDLVDKFLKLGNYFGWGNLILLQGMQRTHDACDVNFWEREWQSVASTHHLIYTEPGEGR